MKKDILELLNSFKPEDFSERVNLHIHSNYSDGEQSPENLVKQAKAKGLRYISICDHNTLKAYQETNILKEDIIIPAIEFDCWHKGVFLHLLGYGVDVNNTELNSFCAKSKKETEADIVRIFSTRDLGKLIQAIHNAGGIASWAHPACCWCIDIEHYLKLLLNLGLDAIEAHYHYARHRSIIKFHKTSTIYELAKKYKLPVTGGTDEHCSLL